MRRVGSFTGFLGLVLFCGVLSGACGTDEFASSELGEWVEPGPFAGELTESNDRGIEEEFVHHGQEKPSAKSAAAKVPINSLIAQDAKLLANDGAAGDRFGTTVAMSGDTIVVGADYDDDNGTDSGAAYVFRNVAGVWVQEAKLLPNDGSAGAHFGQAVAIDGNTIAVGAYLDDALGLADAGSAYVFVRNGTMWTQESKLVADDASAADRLGLSVAIDGDTVLAGAYWADVQGSQDGAAYVFVRMGTTWYQEAKLSADDGQSFDDFGVRLAIDGDLAVVAAHVDDDNGADSGSVYAFGRNAGLWVPQGKIKPADGQAGDQFGFSVAIRGQTFIAGASGDDDQGTDAGAAYIFTRIGGMWTQESKLYASDAAAGDVFGTAVSLTDDMVIVGSYNDDTAAGANAGSVYLFKRNAGTWMENAIIRATDAQAGDILGVSVSLDSAEILLCAGAWGDDDKGSNAGAAYVFSLGKPQGASCMADSECASTFCVDGFCCDTACGGGNPTDCQVCSAGLGSHANGWCAPRPPNTTCRPAVSACDNAEKCDGMSLTCPSDTWKPAGTLCRVAGGVCDTAEYCTGMSNQCPADAVSPTTKVCRSAAGICDIPEKCDGMAKTCPANKYFGTNTICRIPSGTCDAAEWCTGTSVYCPVNKVSPAGTVCRTASGACDAMEKCDGLSTACPADIVKAAGSVCRAAAGTCDIVEKCDGMAKACPSDNYLPLNTVCRGAAGPCDKVETCTGTSGVCPGNQYAALGTVCRAAAGTCDQAETCNGTSVACPTNLFKTAGTVCRPSMNSVCDPSETCSGMAATCPTNAYAPNGTMCPNGTCTNGACITMLADDEAMALSADGTVSISDDVVHDDGDKAAFADNRAAANSPDSSASGMCTISNALGPSHTNDGASYASILALAGAAAIRRRRRSA